MQTVGRNAIHKSVLPIVLSYMLAAVVSNPASAALISYEGFNYGGSINGQTGGTGWTSAWFNHNPVFGDLTISSGLTYSGLPSAGGSAYVSSMGADARTITSQNSGTVWLSFLGNFFHIHPYCTTT